LEKTCPKIYVVYYREDDPGKNTSLKMVRQWRALLIKPSMVRHGMVVLNPYSQKIIGPWVRDQVYRYGLVVVDASWRKLSVWRFREIGGDHYKLPPLLPGNPVNYGKPCMLSSIEAVASTLYITGYMECYQELLQLYKWMNTFHTLNKELLEEYRRAIDTDTLRNTLKKLWGEKPPC